jgi:4-amino-4-deoxy-L-arabinose transferase-like glycosyltransferase
MNLLNTPERRIALALILFLAVLYIPFAGNYGMWDPWETHYSEVARQMLMRHDYVSLWWPGSPQDRNEFWSKPVLTFWVMAIGMAAAGLERVGHAFDGEMAVGWTVEWAVRIPFVICGIICVWAVWELTRRMAGRRAALWSAIVLATASQFFYVTRQAMTDMPFVVTMTIALVYAGLALMLPAEEVGAPLPRRSWGDLSWPHAPSFYVLAALAVLAIVPQLVVISWQVHLAFSLGRKAIRMSGIVPMLPYCAAFVLYAFYACKLTTKRQIYMHLGFLMGGLATLAKGPAGIAMPVLVLLLFLVVSEQWQVLVPPSATEDVRSGGWRGALLVTWRFLTRHPLEIALGVLLFIAVTFPWYHAMLIRHGMGFWNEFIGDNYVHRAAGRHGDRGTFEYYLLQIGHGMFPWSGVVPAAVLVAMGKLRPTNEKDSARAKLRLYALIWFLVMFGTVSLVNTKFHHYILPGLPALAILAGLLLDELYSSPRVRDALAVLLVGVPFVALAGRDLAMFPARLTWLFDYDYVNAPNGGRAWPPGNEYVYTDRIWWFVGFATLATFVLGLVSLVRARRGVELAEEVKPPSTGMLVLLGVIPVATTVAAELWQPAFSAGPQPLASGWILVGAAGGLFLLLLVGAGFGRVGSRAATLGLLAVGVMGCMWTGWGLDRLLTDLSPHWSQKHVIAAYYQLRKSADEPLIAWQMYWRGETFYTKNAIYDHRLPQTDKTVFLADHNVEKMQTYFKTHGGRRVFFIVERSRFESLRALLPEAAKATLKPVDETNNKVYLAVAELPPGDATPQTTAQAAPVTPTTKPAAPPVKPTATAAAPPTVK